MIKINITKDWKICELRFQNTSVTEKIVEELDGDNLIFIEKKDNTIIFKCSNKVNGKLKRLYSSLELLNENEFRNEDIALHPIFVWIKMQTIEECRTNIYTFLNKIKVLQKKDEDEKFLIYLFFDEPKTFSDKYRVRFIEYIKTIKMIPSVKKNVIPVFVNDDLNYYKIRAFMISLARNFKIQRFYYLDDEISEFYEYCNDYLTLSRDNKISTVRALYYMNDVLNKGILKKDINVELHFDLDTIQNYLICLAASLTIHGLCEWEEQNQLIGRLKNCNNIQKLQAVFYVLKSKIAASNLNNNILKSECEAIDKLMNVTNKKFLGQVYLVNYKNLKEEKKKFGTTIYPTHKIVKPNNSEVVLINMESIFGEIFPIENDFTSACEYLDDYFHYYGLLKGVSSYVVYQFAYEAFPKLPRKFLVFNLFLVIK
jgi:hypothetical protein